MPFICIRNKLSRCIPKITMCEGPTGRILMICCVKSNNLYSGPIIEVGATVCGILTLRKAYATANVPVRQYNVGRNLVGFCLHKTEKNPSSARGSISQ